MASYVEGLIERVLGELHQIVKTETVVGEPVTVGELTLIPVSKISFGFGAGGGQEGKGQSGTGGGATVEPIAFVLIDGKGKAQILTLHEKEAGLGQLVDLMPEALAKIKDFVGKKKKEDTAEEGAEASQEDLAG
jgi:uncharacterized spore protein YtfJ